MKNPSAPRAAALWTSIALAVSLAAAACGGGGTAPKSAATASSGSASPNDSEAELHAAFMRGLHENVEKFCACPDAACRKEANDAIQALKNPNTPPTPEEQQQMDADTAHIKECAAKVNADGAK
jgi:hypothetical protein